MQVREGMSEAVLTIGPRHTLRDAAEAMCRRNVGAAVVLDPEAPGPGRDHRTRHPPRGRLRARTRIGSGWSTT